ncbi:MAG: hypothetical protein ACREQX_12450 [Candidatus Binataceae bacterium]
MALSGKDDFSEWRLGAEPAARQEVKLEPAPSRPDLSHERLARPLQTITVELLGWIAVGVWALVTRLVTLGARPLDTPEAVHALYEFAVGQAAPRAAIGYLPTYGGWIHMVSAGLFAGLGSSDYVARLIFALSGLLLIVMTLAMRPLMGRAGALGLATLLAVSPSITWFSRASVTVIPAAAFTLMVLWLFMALKRRPLLSRAAALGVALGLMMAADKTSFVTLAIFAVALGLLGLTELTRTNQAWLRTRVWWRRRSPMVVAAAMVAAIVWFFSELALPGHIQGFAIASLIRSLWLAPSQLVGYLAGARFFVPPLGLYEFLIVIFAIIGALAILTRRMRTRFAAWCLIWAVLSLAFYLWTPARQSGWIVQMLVPMAIVGAFGIEYLHHSEAWAVLRYVFAALLLFTIYMQVMANFVYFAPSRAQAPWARRLSLYTRDATTVETPQLCAAAIKRTAPGSATVFFPPDTAAALRWYLRSLRPVARARDARVVVGGKVNTGPGKTYHFDYEMGWTPSLRMLDASLALAYLASTQVWSPVQSRATTLFVRAAPVFGPTAIFAP